MGKNEPRAILTGNEAVARGAYEYGVRFASGYPGTPSTEILEALSSYDSVYSEWAPNEKVALETAAGASLGGARSLVTMKHVGLNVAADPFFSLSYSGVNAGLIVISADDPGMHSSQNEQDNRHLARAAKIPMLEPSDSNESKTMMGIGLALSEEYDTPVMLRMTTRVSHSESVVVLQDPVLPPVKKYKKDFAKNVLLPSNAKGRHEFVERRMERLAKQAESMLELNRITIRSRELGIISSGVAAMYALEVFPHASILKLGLTNPIPKRLIASFAAMVKTTIVLEELDPYLEEQIRAMGIRVIGKERIPIVGELTPEIVAAALPEFHPAIHPSTASVPVVLPPRPPTLCPGCSHRSVFMTLKKLRAIVTGDIGCYTLGAIPPLETMDTCLDMGASVGMAYGLERAFGSASSAPVVAVIGDSTFLHSGITGLLNIVYNGGSTTVCILDNHITAMTGHQPNPGTGRTLAGKPAPRVDFEQLVRSLGVTRVRKVDPFDIDTMESVFREEIAANELSVVIADAPCILNEKIDLGAAYTVDLEKCPQCGLCVKLGCSALGVTDDGYPAIDEEMCRGCGLCAYVCNTDAIFQISKYSEQKV